MSALDPDDFAHDDEQRHAMTMPETNLCECDFDPSFHRDLNARRGIVDDRCHHEAADHMNGWPGGVVSSPALCMGCLFGCAP